MPPLLILLIGIVTVLGLIIALRLNAFLALITAALIVSMLAPGSSLAGKISRVAEAFGSSAGGIAIVIALAAVIGKCMMDSGSADRVVRSFLNILGEKHASLALMGSGFVLAVPVFFDTVFYLLVPLARSLHRRTKRNYAKYILAIAAGGAITHTLVPPTPGPLLMASNLNIDLGIMIMVGAMVALPAALAGLITASVMDRMLDIPMRQIGSTKEPEPLDDSQLPSLTMSLAPVVLPVLLISANTVLSTFADSEHAALLSTTDVTDWPSFAQTLSQESGAPSPQKRLQELLPTDLLTDLSTTGDSVSEDLQNRTVNQLNAILGRSDIYQPAEDDFDSIVIPTPKIKKQLSQEDLTESQQTRLNKLLTINNLLESDLSRMSKVRVERLNRLLLEVAFPGMIASHFWDTGLRKASNITALFGNPNLALLLSTAVAMLVYYRQRQPTKQEMSMMVEEALLSGGLIILITAGGGAFGAMLKEAQIGDAIQQQFSSGSGFQGMAVLLLGFTIAAVLKVAQGSSTVAMITASSMLAAMLAEPGSMESLGFHPVYLATSIGAGSLIGSWMNDSGFWIFTKMGDLTEVESLKSWTILLLVLGAVSLAMTFLGANFLPLI